MTAYEDLLKKWIEEALAAARNIETAAIDPAIDDHNGMAYARAFGECKGRACGIVSNLTAVLSILNEAKR